MTQQRIDDLIARLHGLAQRSEDAEVPWVGASTEQAFAVVEPSFMAFCEDYLAPHFGDGE